MTIERARAIQAYADSTGTHQEFKARAMSAAARNAQGASSDDE
jgi:Tfp pilus assembly major pilin PilA